MDRLNILYRGPLSSCNYDCNYCPFAKRHETAGELAHDRACLTRFVDWLKTRTHRPHGLLFTPWGEALTRRWYRDAIVELSHYQHLERVAIQTNLSVPLDWLRDARAERVALWCTYHPGEVAREAFVAQCRQLDALGVRYSVGAVGLPEQREAIEALRSELPDDVYLWINAYKSAPTAYDQAAVEFFTRIDPLFPVNNTYHPSFGQPCNTGWTTISVDGEGQVRRCHFIDEVLGNLYETEVETLLRPRRCTRATCGCHIGYVHLPHLGLEATFQENILERIPAAGRAASTHKSTEDVSQTMS